MNEVAENDKKYDVAISYLSRDESLALDISRRLSDSLKVFVYPERQKELAGTDGMESFRSVFYDESRVVVILYRQGWGETNWTKVEETAIKDRVLTKGWEFLFFIELSPDDSLPAWIHKTYTRFNFEAFGIEQAVGAIKAKVLELGGKFSKLDAIGRARILKEDTAFREERKRLFSSTEGVDAVREEVKSIYAEIETKSKEINDIADIQFDVGLDNRKCVLTNKRVSLEIIWEPRFLNSLGKSPLKIVELNGRVLLPEERKRYRLVVEPKRLYERKYYPGLTRTGEWHWGLSEDTYELRTSKDIANECLKIFLDLIDQKHRGELPDLDD